jgi:hypothetical protein
VPAGSIRSGPLAEAEERVERAFALGERALPAAVSAVYRLQRYTLCEFRGNVEEMEPAIRGWSPSIRLVPVFGCVLAELQARVGRPAEAKRTLDVLAQDDFSGVPFDQEWLFAMSMLAETAGLLADTEFASVLYGLLAPLGCSERRRPGRGDQGRGLPLSRRARDDHGALERRRAALRRRAGD